MFKKIKKQLIRNIKRGLIYEGLEFDFVKDSMASKVAILGAKGVGKTTLYNFLVPNEKLTDGLFGYGELNVIDRVYKEVSFFDSLTLKSDRSQQRLFAMKDEIFIFNKDFDFSGDEINRGKWEKVIYGADYIFYLIKSNLVFQNNEEYLVKIEEHVTYIKNIIETNNVNKKLYLICTHCDLIEEYTTDESLFYDTIVRRLFKVNQKDTEIIAGSLKDQENITELTKNICEYLVLECKEA